ncbi:hypothetical protein A5722_27405 [Mycobacterium vulneris]|nr:hypothetical protein A5722_27405 [Mycolicibacterium vulneris]
MDLVVVGIDAGQPIGECAVVDLVTFVGQSTDLTLQNLEGAGNTGTRPEAAVALAEFHDAGFARPRVHIAEHVLM